MFHRGSVQPMLHVAMRTLSVRSQSARATRAAQQGSLAIHQRWVSSSPRVMMVAADPFKYFDPKPEEENKGWTVDALKEASFASFKMDARLKKALTEDFGYLTASPVQKECFEPCMKGDDAVVRASTGSGKTIGFLLPTIQRHFKSSRRDCQKHSGSITALIVSPTRELAMQAQRESEKLLSYFPRYLKVDTCVGGASKAHQLKRMRHRTPFILSATPGRLVDMIETCNWTEHLKNLKVLVLDEADTLLDMGFREDLEKILNACKTNNPDLQTLLFSATFPKAVNELTQLATSEPVHVAADSAGEASSPAESVEQHLLAVNKNKDLMPALRKVLFSHFLECSESGVQPKVMVFFNTIQETKAAHALYRSLGDFKNSYVLHSELNQSRRFNVSGTFRKCETGVLFTTDVSARGVDYPNVSLVVQVGAAQSREAYVHRVGRTGRGGKAGRALQLVSMSDARFVRQHLADFPIHRMKFSDLHQGTALLDDGVDAASMEADIDVENLKRSKPYKRGRYHPRNSFRAQRSRKYQR
eukprot:m.359733 g.359733  ORF g.359733 m.359733 type:complete len:530 (-) comp18696_c0_seq1:308-1897(-)